MATHTVVCLLMVAAAAAVPLRNDENFAGYQCAKQCKARPANFKYSPSETYVYEYKAEADTSVAGASEHTARMSIETLANIEVISTCEFALRLQDVKVFHSEPYSESLKPAERTQEFQSTLTENTLRFSFDDGIIREVCPSQAEKPWVLNFKKGLLSAFQISMQGNLKTKQTAKEIDINGECKTSFDPVSEWLWDSSIKFTKSKDLLSCHKHSSLRSVIPMIPYRVLSDIQSLPIMKSTHNCEHIISSSNILESTVCKESHIFAPFSNQQSGSAVVVKQTLTFKAVKSGVETTEDLIDSHSTLIFHHAHGNRGVSDTKQVAEQKLKEICEQTKNDIRPETPRLFTELVQIVKVLETSDLENLYTMIKNNKLCNQNGKAMKFLLDTLPIAGTPATLDLMVTILKNNVLDNIEEQIWLTSLSLISEPTEEMMPSLLKLLNSKVGEQALLPVSALLNTMCRKNVECNMMNHHFRKIVNKINSNIDSYCSSEIPKIMLTLRAIGNIGYGSAFMQTLEQCMTSRYAPLEVKVAATDAYRRFPCDENEGIDPLFQVFESEEIDPELRIMSFLSLMRCPTEPVVHRIIHQLSQENDINVGTFVSSHLENLKQSSDPLKQGVIRMFDKLYIRKFETAGLTSSRCFESSTLLKKFNLGYVADSDLIFSGSSSVPRQMNLNLTIQMFGNSVNLFEVGARMNGLDKFVEKYFGAHGIFPTNEASPDDLEGFLYARMFGNELFFKHVKGSEEFDKIKAHYNFGMLLENLSKQFNYKYSHSQQLFDESMIIPTAIGLPVNLTVNSSATVHADAEGNVELAGFLSRSKPISVVSNVAASAGVEVTGSMMVDAMFYKQGVRMRNTLHSSVNFKSDLMIKDRQILSFEMETPQDKQELFDARSQFFIIHDSFEKEQKMITENREEYKDCTGDTFAKITGLELCGEVQYPNGSETEAAPYFPFTGPARATVVLNKKDTQRSYKIFAKWIKNSRKLEAQLQLDTPGSQVDRHISADFAIGYHKNPHVDIILLSPWTKFVLNGKAAKNDDIASVTGSLSIDDKLQYKLTSEMKMNSEGKRHEYLPFIEVEKNDERFTILTGSLVHNEKKDMSSRLEVKDLNGNVYNFDNQLSYSPQEKRFTLTVGEKGKRPFMIRIGSIFNKSGYKKQNIKIDPEFVIKTPRGEIVTFKSQGQLQPKPLKISGTMSLNAIRLKKPVLLKVDIRKKGNKYPVNIKMQLLPRVSGNVKGRIMVLKSSYSGQMEIIYRAGSLSDYIKWNGKLQDRKTKYNLNSNLKFKKNPDYNMETFLEVAHKKDKLNSGKLTVYYGRNSHNVNKMVKMDATIDGNIKDLMNAQINADIKVKVPEKNVDMKMNLNHKHTKQVLDSDVHLDLTPLFKNPIKAGIFIHNKGSSLYNVIGRGNLETDKNKYNVNSNLIQSTKSKISHTISFSTNNEKNHEMSTILKNGDDFRYSIDLTSEKLKKPLTLEFSGNKDPSDFSVKTAISQSRKELYSIEAMSKMDAGRAGRWSLAVAHPERTVKLGASFNKAKDRTNADASINWNVGSRQKPLPKIELSGQFTHSMESESISLKSNLKLETPFKGYEKLSTNMIFDKSESELKSSGRISWGGYNKQITSQIMAQLPITAKKAEIQFEAKTPFSNYKKVELEVQHSMDSNIKTLLRGKVNKDETELKINGKHEINNIMRNIEGDIILRTPYKSMKQVMMSIEHSADSKDFKNVLKFNKDGNVYKSDLKSSNIFEPSETEKSGKLTITVPDKSAAETSFLLKNVNGKRQLQASFAVGKNHRKQMNVDVTGSYLDLNHFNLEVDVKSPWKNSRKFGIEIHQQIDQGEMKMKAVIVKNRAKTGYDIQLKNEEKRISSSMLLLLSPLYENDVMLMSHVMLDKYPFTISSKISWAPHSVIDFSGSYKAEVGDDMELNMKLTTPFKYIESLNLVASNKNKNSLTVSHFNLGYNVRRMIDLELIRQNDEKKKRLGIKVKVPGGPIQSFEAGIRMDLQRDTFAKGDIELVFTPKDKYEGTISLRFAKNNNLNGKLEIKTPIDQFKLIEGTLTRSMQRNGQTSSLKLKKDGDHLIDIAAIMDMQDDNMNVEIVSQGQIVEIAAEVYENVAMGNYQRFLQWLPKKLLKNKGQLIKKLIMQIKTRCEKDHVHVEGSITVDYGKHKLLRGFEANKNGESYNNMDMDLKLIVDGESLGVNVVSKVVDDIRLKAMFTDFKENRRFGFEFNQVSTSSHHESNGKIYLSFSEKPDLQFDLFMTDIQHIEFTSEFQANNDRRKFKYTHEGQDNRISCTASLAIEETIISKFELVSQSSPIKLFTLKWKTPFDKMRDLVVSGDFDETKFNGLFKLNEEELMSIHGSHKKMENLKFILKTTLPVFPLISFECVGALIDGRSQFSVEVDKTYKIDGNVLIKYESLSQVKVSASVIPQYLESTHNLKLEYEATEEPLQKTYLHLAVDKENQISYSTKTEFGNHKNMVEAYFNGLGFILIKNDSDEKTTGTAQLLEGITKVFDADIVVDKENENKATLSVRKPFPMEYRIIQDQGTNEKEIFIHWDKTNPDAQLTLTTDMKDNSNSYKTDTVFSVKVSCPRRSIGIEHSVTVTAVDFHSTAKVFWNDDRESQVSYDLQLKDLSNRRQNYYNGELKVELPTRTVGLSGYGRDHSGAKEAQAAFSWDLENDASKRIGLKGILHKGSYTQADVSLILPKEAHVDSKFILNKGSTVLEGQTQIFFSNDDRRTLTLFSKVENNDASGYSKFFYTEEKFNYSIQAGMSHPESRMDVKIVSHVAHDSERFTSALGLNFLNSRKQMKNFDLFLEINQLKKEISLVANNPYKSFGFSGALIKQDPLEMKATMTVDQEERREIHVVAKPDQNRIDLHSKKVDQEFIYSASYPNKTSLLIERNQLVFGSLEPEYRVLFQLSSPDVFQATLNWRHGLVKEARDRFFDYAELVFTDLKELADGIIQDVEREVIQHYKDISGSLFDDVKGMVDMIEQELAAIHMESRQMKHGSEGNFDLCGGMEYVEQYMEEGISQYIMSLNDGMEMYITRYRQSLRSLSNQIEKLQRTAVDKKYQDLIKDLSDLEEALLGTSFLKFLKGISDINPEKFRKFWEDVDKGVEKHLDPQPFIDNLNAYVKDLMDKQVYIEMTKQLISDNKLMIKVKKALSDLKQKVMALPLVQGIKNKVEKSEAYIYAIDTIESLKLEETVLNYLEKSSNLIIEVVEEQMEERLTSVFRVIRNPITKFNPKNGILQVQVPLILSFDRIDQIPTSAQLADKVIDFVFGNSSRPQYSEMM